MRVSASNLQQSIDDGAVKWMIKTAIANQWRCLTPDKELDDLIQDGYLCYAKVREVYPHITDRPHIMRLFQTTYTNHLHGLAKRKTKLAAEVDMAAYNEVTSFRTQARPAEICQFSETLRLLSDCRPIVRLLIATLDAKPERLRRPFRVGRSRRETTNERMCRLLGRDPSKINLHKSLRIALSTV